MFSVCVFGVCVHVCVCVCVQSVRQVSSVSFQNSQDKKRRNLPDIRSSLHVLPSPYTMTALGPHVLLSTFPWDCLPGCKLVNYI
jgi:hypothetical protein